METFDHYFSVSVRKEFYTMPIIIKDYVWTETINSVTIQVPFRNVKPVNADIFFTPQYMKASVNQLFFEVFLLEPVNISQSKCTKTDNSIIFELLKKEEKLWNVLEPDISKQEKFELKKKLIAEEHERFQNECKERADKKCELKRVAVREQIELDNKNRNLIEKIKKDEESKALGDIETWRKKLNNPKSSPKIQEVEHIPMSKLKIHKPKRKTEAKKVESVPKPRSSRSLQVLFTAREFPTPCRESRMEEENEWLRKQAEARRSAGFVSDDIRPEEKNPQFLMAKGIEFMKNKNFLGAISVFSYGINLCEKFVDFYIARSEAHLALENFNRTVNDCSTALDLLKPAIPINLKERALCIGRRGIALCKLNMFKHGISELEASLKLLPNDSFEQYLQEAKDQFELLKENHKNKEL